MQGPQAPGREPAQPLLQGGLRPLGGAPAPGVEVEPTPITASRGAFLFNRQNSFKVQGSFKLDFRNKSLKYSYPAKGLHSYLILGKGFEEVGRKVAQILNWVLKTCLSVSFRGLLPIIKRYKVGDY